MNSGKYPTGTLYNTVGWKPTCACECMDVVPATVLDPFCGTGTTVVVANQLGRNAIGIDISEQYKQIYDKRVSVK